MSIPPVLTREQAARFLSALHFPDPAGRSVEETVRRLGCVQFDPLYVAGRNHDLVLQSRLPAYRVGDLERSMYGADPRELVEGVDKQLSVFLVGDWPRLKRMRHRLFTRHMRGPELARALPAARAALRHGVPLRAEDLDLDGTVDWSWGPTRLSRAALEALWYGGEAVVHHREGTRRFYAPAECVLPDGIADAPDPFPDEAAYLDWHVARRITGIGLARPVSSGAWNGVVNARVPAVRASFARLREEGRILPVSIEGLSMDPPYHMAAEHLPVLEASLTAPPTGRVRFLAPLDNLLWDRDLVRRIFGFDYRWEVYTPVPKRRYGYYVLPVLRDGRMIARWEPERCRPGEGLRIRAWWWEPGVPADEHLRDDTVEALERFAEYLKATGPVRGQDRLFP